jgi:alkylhydroperoxidase/carboxymuconolactone decarboxylase family protein YurZ
MTAKVSPGFAAFANGFPDTAQAQMALVHALRAESALDTKTKHLTYLAVLAASRLTGGIEFHVKAALQAGASRDEVLSACLAGLPAVGLQVMDALAAALSALGNSPND